jgi:hypothetical protein
VSNKEVIDFLEPLRLEKYSTIMIQQGFDDLDSILGLTNHLNYLTLSIELDRDCLQEMRVTLGHQIKIMKEIKKIKIEKEKENLMAPKEKATTNLRSDMKKVRFKTVD